MNINYRNFNGTTRFVDGDVPYISARNLEATGIVKNAFSTRIGGVSTGIYESMNLTFTREDNPGYSNYETDVFIIESVGKVFPVFFFHIKHLYIPL